GALCEPLLDVSRRGRDQRRHDRGLAVCGAGHVRRAGRHRARRRVSRSRDAVVPVACRRGSRGPARVSARAAGRADRYDGRCENDGRRSGATPMSQDLQHVLSVLALVAAAVFPAAGTAQEGADADAIEEIEGIEEIEEIDIDDLPPPAEETCFYSRDIDRFSALSDSFVLLRDRSRKYYLLTMFPGCVGLDQSIRIALISDLQRVCELGR